jgi:hypothetical protein
MAHAEILRREVMLGILVKRLGGRVKITYQDAAELGYKTNLWRTEGHDGTVELWIDDPAPGEDVFDVGNRMPSQERPFSTRETVAVGYALVVKDMIGRDEAVAVIKNIAGPDGTLRLLLDMGEIAVTRLIDDCQAAIAERAKG